MTPLLEAKVDNAIAVAMARALARHSKATLSDRNEPSHSQSISTCVASKAALPETTAAWRAIMIRLLSGVNIEPRDTIKLNMISPQQLYKLTQFYEAVGAISTFWKCRHADQPWTDEELYMPTLKFTQQQF